MQVEGHQGISYFLSLNIRLTAVTAPPSLPSLIVAQYKVYPLLNFANQQTFCCGFLPWLKCFCVSCVLSAKCWQIWVNDFYFPGRHKRFCLSITSAFLQHLRHLAQRRRSAPSLVFGKALGMPWSPIRCAKDSLIRCIYTCATVIFLYGLESFLTHSDHSAVRTTVPYSFLLRQSLHSSA